MATSNPKAQIEAAMDASGVRPGFEQIKQDAKGMGKALQEAGQVGDRALKTIGEGAKSSADVTSRAAGSMAAAITRATNQLQLAGKSASEAFALKIDQKGLDPARFQPAIAKLREAEAAAKAFQDQLRADDAARSAAAAQQQFIANLREQISLQGRSTDEVLRYRAAQLGVGAAASPLITQLQNQRAAQEAATQAAREEAAAQRAAADAKQRAISQQQAFIASLRDQVALQGKSQAEALSYRAAQLGVSQEAAAYIAQIDRANASTSKLGVSAGQTTAALRQLPAQFTDIFVSLQAGQSPLTVFFQQFGQIKDSFGGVGPAVRELGKFILGLISPGVIAAGVLGTLAVAAHAGAEEDARFRQSLILTGNAIGTTSDKLGVMATRVGALSGNQGKAAEVLDQFVNKGKVAADNLERFTAASINMERASGPAIEATVQTFAQLAEKPYEAAVKLNQAVNFLTASQLRQIKSLQDAGEETRAARIAQEAYATALEQRAPQMEQTLGLLERGWRGITEATKGAWDAAKNVGREDTLSKQIADLEKARDKLRGAANGGQQLAGFRQAFRDFTGDRSFADQADDLDKVIARLKQSVALGQELADKDRERLRTTELMRNWLDDEGKYLERSAAAKREIAKIEEDGRALVQRGLISEAQLRERVAAARAKFADKTGDNELASLNAKLKATNSYIDALTRQGGVARELNEGEKAAAQIREQLERSRLSAGERAQKQRELQVATELGQRQALAAALKGDSDLAGRQVDQLGQQADALRKKAAEQDAANAAAGKGASAIEALRLAELKKQAADLEATDRVIPAYLAGLHQVIAAQQKVVDSQKASDYKQLNQGALEWLRTASEASRLQAAEPAMLALTATARQRLVADREVELKLAEKIAEVERSGLPVAEQAAVIEKLRAAATKDREKNATAAQQAALREINDFLDPGRAESFTGALTKGFEAAGNGLARMSTSLSEFARQQSAIAKQQANINLLPKGSTEALNAQNRLNERSQQNQVALYASMTGAAKGFFGEGSRGYKALEAAETAFRLVQLAGDLQRGLSAAAVGIATQAQGDPYSAFPRMAAMAATMAALGFAVGFTGGGEHSGGDGRPVNNGTGTVLGDSNAQSESIGRSIDRLADTAKLQLSTQSGMLSALRNIESSIGGLATLVVRGSTLADPGIKQGTTLPSYISNPGVATIMGGAVGLAVSIASKIPVFDKIVAALFGSKTKVTGQGLYADPTSLASINAGGINLKDFVDVNTTKKFFGVTYSNKSSTNYSPADAQLQQQFGQVFKDFYGAVLASATPLGQALDVVKARLDGFVVNIGKIDLQGLTGTQIQEKLSAVLGAAADNIANAAIPGLGDFQKVGEGYFETLVRVASGVETAKASLDMLGISAIAFGDVTRKQGDVAAEIVRQSIAAYESAGGALSSVGTLISNLDGSADDLTGTYKALVDVRDALIGIGESGNTLTASLLQGAGGLDGLSSSLSTYMNAFFTDQERAAAALSTVTAQFGRIGITAVPQDREGFKALVESIDGTTDAGQRLKGQVLALAGAFDEAQTLAEKAKGAVSSLANILANQASERDGLLVDLLKAQGDTAGAAQLKRSQDLAKLTAGLTAAEAEAATKGYDYIASLRAQIDTLQAATVAAQQAAQAEAARLAQRDSIQASIDQLLGNTAAIRARELAALDPANRADKERYYALLDEATAAQAAAQAAQELASKMQAVANERDGIQGAIDQLQGNTAAIRARELATLDPTNRALKEHYYALLDQQKAAEEAAEAARAAQAAEQAAAQAAAQAAEQLRQAWQSVTDGLLGEVNRIRGLGAESSPESFAQAQAKFAITLAQARSGDQDAGKLLPQLSQAMLMIAQSQATSAFDLDLLRSKTAASLNAVATQLAAQFGLTIPKLATGTNYVPRDMLAFIHQGEAVVPKAFNPAHASGGGSLRDVADAIGRLQADQREQASTQARQQRELLQLQKRWDQEGMPSIRPEEVES